MAKERDYWLEGFNAFDSGRDFSECPYPPDSENGKAWLDGYYEAEDLARDAEKV